MSRTTTREEARFRANKASKESQLFARELKAWIEVEVNKVVVIARGIRGQRSGLRRSVPHDSNHAMQNGRCASGVGGL